MTARRIMGDLTDRLKRTRGFLNKWMVVIVVVYLLVWGGVVIVETEEVLTWYNHTHSIGGAALLPPSSVPDPPFLYKWLCTWTMSEAHHISNRIVGGGLILFLLYSFLYSIPITSEAENNEEVKNGRD